MKKTLPAVLVLLGWGLLVAMGAAPTRELPVPELDFRATVIDDHDISTRCTNVSWEGETFFEGRRGGGVVTIPFEKVKKARYVSGGSSGKVNFQIVLKGGDVVAISLDEESRFFGKTSFGTFRIFAKNIKEIVFAEAE